MERSLSFFREKYSLYYALILIFFSVFVLAVAPNWTGSDVNYTILEGDYYIHNLSKNITGFGGDVNFTIDTDSDITWVNASGTNTVSASDVSSWINIYNKDTGNLTINATTDFHSGFFIIPMQATNTTDSDFQGTSFEFIINATNDFPNFTSVNDNYVLAQEVNFLSFLNASDEEGHYPLTFNVTFNESNCTHASWSSFNDNENCSLFDFGFTLTDHPDTAALMNYTPEFNEVGLYWANVSVTDYNAGCPHVYCNNATYENNLTTYHSQIVLFKVDASLSVNVTNCTDQTIQEGEQFNCTINITSRHEADELNLSSYAFFRNWGGSYYSDNRDWFYANSTNTTASFLISIPISITPQKKEVGNWTINFTADDGALPVVEPLNLFVNFTEDSVSLDPISDIQVYENESFNALAYDNDLLIRDGSIKQESLTFAANESWVNVGSSSNTVGNNYSTSLIKIDYDTISLLGDANYTVLVNVTDEGGNTDSTTFVVEVYNDTPAEWNDTSDYVFVFDEDENIFINLSDYVTDADGDTINFSYENDSRFDNFNLTIGGIINFTPEDVDVGYHNLTINASDGKIDSFHVFNFTILNVVDVPLLSHTSNVYSTEDVEKSNVLLTVTDDDFLILDTQKDFYNESLSISVTFENLTVVDIPINYTYNLLIEGNPATYSASFTPNESNVGDYNVTINVTDYGGEYNITYYELSVNQSNDPPVMDSIDNQTFTIYDLFYLDVNSTDEEDSSVLPESGSLNYTLDNLTVGGDFLEVNITSGVFNLTLNSTYEGAWHYNLTVNDTNGSIDYQDFWLYVYGEPQLFEPNQSAIFNLTENLTTLLNFTFNHSVGDNLTYEFWIDSIGCDYLNASSCNYTNLSLRTSGNYLSNGTNFSWEFTPNFTDETYGNLKNLTLVVYPNNTDLNSTQKEQLKSNFTFNFNVSHTNHPPIIYSSFGSHLTTYGETTPVQLDLSSYIRDYDYSDSYYLEAANFTLTSNASSSIIRAEAYSVGNRLPWNGTIANWTLELYGEQVGAEAVTLIINDSHATDTSDPFSISFSAPSVITDPDPTPSTGGSSRGGSGSDKVKHFSLKVIAPHDVIISENNYIEVPFSVQNNGQLDLVGINLSSHVMFNNLFTEEVQISLNDAYIPLLKFGQTENFSMRIVANTQKSGKYKATIFANVTSPKFSDWGDFFIDLQRVNESEAEQILIFTEQLIADNPECLELTENLKMAQEAFLGGDPKSAIVLSEQIITSCEDSIGLNEQMRYSVSGFVEKNFFYIFSVTLGIFLLGFMIYIYKRVRFNKSRSGDYI